MLPNLSDGKAGRGNQLYELPNKRITKLGNEEALALVKSVRTMGEGGRDPTHIQLERLWFQAIAYYAGLQSSTYGEALQDDFAFEQSLVIPAYAANHIGRMVRHEVSRLSRARPTMEVTPNSPDQKDVFGAKVAHYVADWIYNDSDLQGIRDELAFWMACCGTAFDWHGWDPRAGGKRRSYIHPMTGEKRPREDLDEQELQFYESYGLYEDVAEGDFDNEVLSPFQVRLPVGPTKLDRMPWATVTRLMSLNEIWDRWPKKAAQLRSIEQMSTSIDGYYWRRLATLVSSIGHSFLTRGSSYMEGIEVHYHIVPVCERFPNGLYIVATNEDILENGPHPYMTMGVKMKWPFTDYHFMPVPGRYHSKGMVEDLIGPQEDYNLGRQQTIAQRDVMSKPQWMVPRQAQMSSEENTLGVVWEYNAHGGGKPELVNPPTVGQHQLVSRDHTLQDMQTLAAQSDVTQAQVPSGVRSGVAINALQEKDEMVGASTHGRMERSFQRSMRARLMLFAKFVKAPRKIEIYGSGRQADLAYLTGEQLNNNVGLRIQPGSMLPRSRALQQALFLDAMQAGFLDPMDPETRRFGLEILEMGNLQQALFEFDGHARRANIENERYHFGAGADGFPDIDDDDDHEVHVRRHLAFKLTDSYERLPLMRKMAFDAHIVKHRAAQARIMTAPLLLQQQLGGMQQGGSPPKQLGEASQPRQPNSKPDKEVAVA